MAKAPPKRGFRAPSLSVDPQKYPNLSINPALERALRIRQELQKGRPRDEAVALADQAMGRLGKPASVPAKGRPKPVGRPASGPRPDGQAAAPRRKPAAATMPGKRRR
jgi:hypothetical protein